MRSFLSFFFLLLSCSFSGLFAQAADSIPEQANNWLGELTAAIEKSGRSDAREINELFQVNWNSGAISEAEQQTIQPTLEKMLAMKLTVEPFFKLYQSAINASIANGFEEAERTSWAATYKQMLDQVENRRIAPLKSYLTASRTYFEHHAIWFSKNGMKWLVPADKTGKWSLGDDGPQVAIDQFDLKGLLKTDSIEITSTSGVFYPLELLWKGNGGQVTWERVGLDAAVYAELETYEFEVKRSLYNAPNAKLYYPDYFGAKAIPGKFTDKVSLKTDSTTSYPRFESTEKVVELKDVGKGVSYRGGFRLEGSTVLGYGTYEEPARVEIKDEAGRLRIRASSEAFAIRQRQQIGGRNVHLALYMGPDSIFHPSTIFRYNINSQEVTLSRSDKAAGQNPYYSSTHDIQIDVDNIYANLPKDSIAIGRTTASFQNKSEVTFESMQFFNANKYRRFQNIASANPLAIIYATVGQERTRDLPAQLIAERINSRFTVDNIKDLIYDLVRQGFITYHPETERVIVGDKLLHYVGSSRGRNDYDQLTIRSNTEGVNGYLNLKDKSIVINGVRNIEFSPQQRTAVKPFQDQIVFQPDRSVDFDGDLFAGYGVLSGKDFSFSYDNFEVKIDSARYFDLYVPSDELDKKGRPKAYAIDSRLEHVGGVLLIDAPNNKSGKEDLPYFPALETKRPSYVYYTRDTIMGGAYSRDSFYFEVTPFSFPSLDNFTEHDVRFGGKLVSSGMLPDIQDTLVIRKEDQSLGFVHPTPDDGYGAYGEKGQFTGDLDLSNKGLTAQGNITYLNASIDSDDIAFRPDRLNATADQFNLEETTSPVPVPQVRGSKVSILWRPYKDSMYVTNEADPFGLFAADEKSFDGTLILTPGGLKGDGKLDWEKAYLESDLLAFGTNQATADTMAVAIKAFDADALALSTKNVNGSVDFTEGVGSFDANADVLVTALPYNQYSTSFNAFDWDMKEDLINFKSEKGQRGLFVSTHPEQDSLQFEGEDALYDLKTSDLKISGVPYIVAGNAFIYPDSNYVEVEAGGIMKTLENARIVADTTNKYHVINRATVEVGGFKYYTASGFYEYNVGPHEQEIELQNIVGQRVGKGKRSEKKVVTRATGEISDSTDFYIDHKTKFRGTISLNAESKNLTFDGYAQLDADLLPRKNWFSISSVGDKKDLAIAYDTPKHPEGFPVATGLYLGKENARIYPSAMQVLRYRKDRAILPAKGYMRYDEDQDRFLFGDSTKVLGQGLEGNLFVFNNKDGSVEGEGKLGLCGEIKYLDVVAAGTIETKFAPPGSEEEETAEEEDNAGLMLDAPIMLAPADMTGDSTTVTIDPSALPKEEIPVTAAAMVGISMPIPDRLIKTIANDIQSSSFAAGAIPYPSDLNFYRKVVSELFDTKEKGIQESLSGLTSGFLDLPAKQNTHNFLFSKLPLKWNSDYQSFVTTAEKNGLVSVGGTSINKMVEVHVEFKMPSNGDDRLYIYLKSPSGNYYFFGFKQGILSISSNNVKFMDEVYNLKKKEASQKMKDGEFFEIQGVETSTANRFLRRVQAAQE